MGTDRRNELINTKQKTLLIDVMQYIYPTISSLFLFHSILFFLWTWSKECLLVLLRKNLTLPYHTTNKANTCLTQMTNVRLLSAQRNDKDKKRGTIDRGLKTLPHLAFTSIEMPLPVSVPRSVSYGDIDTNLPIVG
jgi:hypothetical protein